MDDLICGVDCAQFSLENCINMQPEGLGDVIGICKSCYKHLHSMYIVALRNMLLRNLKVANANAKS